MTTTTDYQQQGIDFLNATQTVMNVKFLRNGKHFDDDTDNRDIYEIELSKGGRSYKFEFGQSINHSGKFRLLDSRAIVQFGKTVNELPRELKNSFGLRYAWENNKEYSQPTAYDVFACLTKSDPGTFENFCNEYGYDTDSRKAEKVYNAVREEYLQLSRLYTEKELEQMQEIA